MKRVLSMLLVLVITFSLAACGAKEPAPAPAPSDSPDSGNDTQQEETAGLQPEEGAELVVWESHGPEGDFIKYAAEKFEEKYGVTVTYEEVESVDATKKVGQDGPAGVGPDVFSAPHDHTGEIVASGLAAPNAHADRIKAEYMEAAVNGLSYQGEVYGYPTAIETYGLFYNKDIFPEAPKSYEEIEAKAKEFNNAEQNEFAFMWDVGNAYFSHSFVAGGGGYIFGQGGTDKNDVGIDSEGAIAGAQTIIKLKDILPIPSGDTTSQIMEGLFDEGKVGAMIDGPWAVAGRKESGVNFAVAPLPKLYNGEQQSSFSGIRGLFVSAYSKYPQAAQLFADFVTSEELLLKRFELTSQIPPMTALADAEQIKNDPFVAPFLDQAQYAVPMPSIPQMGIVWDPYGAAFSSMWDEGTSPEDALGTAAETVRDAIANEQQ